MTAGVFLIWRKDAVQFDHIVGQSLILPSVARYFCQMSHDAHQFGFLQIFCLYFSLRKTV